MSNQLFHNGQGLHNYNAARYQDLRREADRERLARQIPGANKPRPGELMHNLVPVALVLSLVVGAAVALG
jgi:hypothetical protein